VHKWGTWERGSKRKGQRYGRGSQREKSDCRVSGTLGEKKNKPKKKKKKKKKKRGVRKKRTKTKTGPGAGEGGQKGETRAVEGKAEAKNSVGSRQKGGSTKRSPLRELKKLGQESKRALS